MKLAIACISLAEKLLPLFLLARLRKTNRNPNAKAIEERYRGKTDVEILDDYLDRNGSRMRTVAKRKNDEA